MTRRVNYADNIFFLKLVLKQVTAALKLAVDPGLGREKLLGDLDFLQRAAGSVFASLRDNHLLIDRSEHLQDLARFDRQLVSLLEETASGRSPGTAALLPQGGQEALERIRQALLGELAEIREALSDHRQAPGDHEHIVSEEEFKFLLASEEGER